MQRSETRLRPRRRSALLTLTILLLAGGLLGTEFYREWRQEQLNRALVNALEYRSMQELPVLLHQGANPNCRLPTQSHLTWQELLEQWLHGVPPNRSTDTVLILAAKRSDVDCVELLLSNGAEVNATNGSHETALTAAFSLGREGIMLALLKHGANPNVQTAASTRQQTPLLIQILTQYQFKESNYLIPLVQLMLDKRADVNAQDSSGNSPLHLAIEFGQTSVARLLIARNADINRPNSNKQTPLELSSNDESDKHAVLNDLLKHGVNVRPDQTGGWNLLCWAAQVGDIAVTREAIRRGVPVNSTERKGRTPLMYAAAYEEPDILALLLANGAE